MTNRIMFNNIGSKKLLILVITLIIAVSIPITLAFLKKQQETRSRASEEAVTLLLEPATGNKTVGEDLDVAISIQAGGNNIKGVDLALVINTTLLEFKEFIPSTAFNDQLIKNFSTSSGTLRYTATDTTNNQITGVVSLGTLKLKAKDVGAASVAFIPDSIKIIARSLGSMQTINNSVGSYTISAPIPTPTLAPNTVDISFSPNTLAKELNSTFDVEFNLNAGANDITGVDITVNFNKDLLTLTSLDPTDIFSDQLINSIDNNTGTLRYTAVDTQDSQNGSIKLGTLNFSAKAVGQANVEITNAVITTLGKEDPLVVTKTPATYTITEISPTPTETPAPTAAPTPAPTESPTAIPVPTSTPIPSPTSDLNATYLSFDLTLPGIGAGGNLNPINSQKQAAVEILDVSNQKIEGSGIVTFDTASNTFKGNINMGNNIQTGDYTVKVKVDKYLKKFIPGIQNITRQTANQMPSVTLYAGDSNNDNKLDIADYNMLTSCYGAKMSSPSCINKTNVDLNDDGNIDGVDYAIFIRGLSVKTGD